MRQLILICLFLTTACLRVQAKREHCKTAEKHLVDKQHNFFNCAIDSYNSTEFSVCGACVSFFNDMQSASSEVQNNCTENTEPFGMLATVQATYIKLWDQAYCDECSINTTTMSIDLFNNFTTCSYQSKNICEDCLIVYQNFNDFYINLEKTNKGRVCYDIYFQMNQARMTWSKDCQRQADLFLFYIPISLVLCLTMAFYGVNIWITKRQERNHELLHNIDAEIRQRAGNAGVNGNTATTQEQPISIVEEQILAIDPPLKPMVADEDSDDSIYSDDDDPILPIKKQHQS